MNRYARLLALTVAGFLALAPSLAVAQTPPSSDQRRALGDAEADRLIRKELLSILRPLPNGFGGGNRRRIGEQTLFTRSYGTAYANLCRTDLLTIHYAPTESRERYENSPIAPYGVSVDTWYHLSGAPRLKTEAFSDNQVWDDACERLTPETYLEWFDAPTEEAAALAGNLQQATIERVRAGTLTPERCEGLHDEKKSCVQLVLEEAASPHNVSKVILCDAPAGRECYRIDLGWDTGLTIAFTRKAGAIVPYTVESLKVEQFIIIT